MSYHFKLTSFRSSEKNRFQNYLTFSNIQLETVDSDTFCKSAQAIQDKLLVNPADTSFALEPLVFKSKKKLPELRDAINFYITPEQAGKRSFLVRCRAVGLVLFSVHSIPISLSRSIRSSVIKKLGFPRIACR